MYVAVRDTQLAHSPHPADPLRAMADLGVASVELMVPPEMKTTAFRARGGEAFDLNTEADELAATCKAAGVSVCALLLGNRFEQDDAEQTDWLVRSIVAANRIGAAAVRVDVVARGMEPEPFLAKAVRIIRSALDQTADTPVPLGVENHGHTSNRAEFLHELFGAVGSSRFGLTLDTGNFYWFGYPLEQVYEIMEELAPTVKHTHVKNICYPEQTRQTTREPGWEYSRYVCPVPDGDIDHGRVAGILKAAGYNGAFTLEDESYGRFDDTTAAANLRRNVEHLKAVV